jgi:hypothetical protein
LGAGIDISENRKIFLKQIFLGLKLFRFVLRFGAVCADGEPIGVVDPSIALFGCLGGFDQGAWEGFDFSAIPAHGDEGIHSVNMGHDCCIRVAECLAASHTRVGTQKYSAEKIGSLDIPAVSAPEDGFRPFVN